MIIYSNSPSVLFDVRIYDLNRSTAYCICASLGSTFQIVSKCFDRFDPSYALHGLCGETAHSAE